MDRIDGVDKSGALKVRVRAVPVDGAANEALVRLLSDALGVSLAQIAIVGGSRGRRKLVEISEAGDGRLNALWPGLTK